MHHMASEPPKIYPAHLLLITNYRLPNDVDRCHLEVSLYQYIGSGIKLDTMDLKYTHGITLMLQDCSYYITHNILLRLQNNYCINT